MRYIGSKKNTAPGHREMHTECNRQQSPEIRIL